MGFEKGLTANPEKPGLPGESAGKTSANAANRLAVDGAARIKFEAERQRYTVQARDERFVILTKPFNARRTYLYTIADLAWGVRGPCNLIFGLPNDVHTPEGAAKALAMLQCGEMEVSFRNHVPLLPSEMAQLKGAPA